MISSSSISTVSSSVPDAPARTRMSNSSLTESVPSLAVTFTVTVPTSAPCGVPEKVRSSSSKESQSGSVALPLSVAV